MRELLLKNLTSLNKKRKILSLSEVSRNNGILTKVNRRFIYLVKEMSQIGNAQEKPEFFIFKNHNSKLRQERFNLRIKGNFYVACNERIYLVSYCHSLKIRVSQQDEVNCPEN
jgi:hypothetical protein